ncbi:MAG: hypothetical protein ACRBFS_22010 [Aureispira sp.]
MLKTRLIIIILISLCSWTRAQTPQYQVEFDTGQTAISLAQLDSIKALVRRSKKTGLSKIRVLAYAHDAKEGDTNEQLSRRRAYLIQQCLEREGVALSKLHIQNIVCDATVEVCTACANLSLEEGNGIRPRNSYTQRNREFLYKETNQEQERFWIDPTQEHFLVSKDGVLIHLPANTLVTSYNSPVQLTLKILETSRQNWCNGLVTSTEQMVVINHKTIHLQASQEGAPLPNTLRYPVTIVVPNEHDTPQQWKLWQQQDQYWQRPSPYTTTALFLGEYYKKIKNPCTGDNKGAIYAPDYGAVPPRPAYINIKEATALQDAAIAALEERLEPLEGMRYSKNGKKEIWTPQQKQRAYQLNNQKSLLLVTREKIRREAQDKNVALEEIYYTKLGQYNKKRHELQTRYVKAIEQRARQGRYEGVAPETIMEKDRCLALQHYQKLLKATYDATTYEQLHSRLAQLQGPAGEQDLGYWIKSEQLGWLSLGQAQSPSKGTARFFAQCSVSPYKITAYYHQQDGQIFNGEPQEDGRLAFVGIDPLQQGEILAVLEEDGAFLLALQPIGGNAVSSANKTIGLQFEFHSLEEALQLLNE